MSSTFRSGYVISDQNATHFLTFSVCGWIDLFTRLEYKNILIDALTYAQNHKGLKLNAFVIMTNHIHLIASADDGCKLSDIVRDFKKYTHNTMMPVIQSDRESRRLWMLHQFKYYAGRHSRNENFQIWTNNNHPEECFTKEFTDIKLSYIHENPVRAGIVTEPEHYIFSSASNYAGKSGMIQVELV